MAPTEILHYLQRFLGNEKEGIRSLQSTKEKDKSDLFLTLVSECFVRRRERARAAATNQFFLHSEENVGVAWKYVVLGRQPTISLSEVVRALVAEDRVESEREFLPYEACDVIPVDELIFFFESLSNGVSSAVVKGLIAAGRQGRCAAGSSSSHVTPLSMPESVAVKQWMRDETAVSLFQCDDSVRKLKVFKEMEVIRRMELAQTRGGEAMQDIDVAEAEDIVRYLTFIHETLDFGVTFVENTVTQMIADDRVKRQTLRENPKTRLLSVLASSADAGRTLCSVRFADFLGVRV